MSKTTGKRKFDFYILPVIEEMGLDRVIEQVGIDRVIEAVGWERAVREKRLPWLLSKLAPEQRRELKELL